MKKIIVITIIIIIIGVTIYFTATDDKNNSNRLIAPVQQKSAQFDDKIISWKTYQDNKYGFEIKYPNNWMFKVIENKFLIKAPGEIAPILDIDFVDEKYSTILANEQNYFEKWQKEAIEKPSGEINDILLAGNTAKEFLYYSPVGFTQQKIILSINNRTVVIGSYKNSILDPVLSTFKFTK